MLVLEEKLYTSEETAEILGINPRTLYRYLKKGDIECETKTKSGTFRFSREQIYKYLYPEKYKKILTLLRQKEDIKYPYINNSVLDSVKETLEPQPISKDRDEPIQNKPIDEVVNLNKDLVDSFQSNSVNNLNSNSSTSGGILPTLKPDKQKPTQQNTLTSPTGNLYKPLKEDNDSSLMGDTPLNDISKKLDTVPVNDATKDIPDINIPDPHASTPSLNTNTTLPNESSAFSNNSGPSDKDIDAIREERKNKKLTDELENLESTIDSPSDSNKDSKDNNKDISAVREAEQNWRYFVNTNKDILQLAKEINSLNAETGRHYAATMKGGLSLHHNIDEFNTVHFYIEEDDLNWWISHLELSICKKEEANICLIPTADMSLFESAYKLRGLFVVSDDRLIQDLMKHGEKELAKTLL